MQKFLSQFNLSPMARVDMENFIYAQADKMLEGYQGGMWESKKVGDVWVLALPVSGERVRLINYAFGGDITTDPLTAAACFASIVTNWYMNLRHEQGRITDAAIEGISDYAGRLGDVVSAKANGINSRDFFNFTD